MKQLFICLFFLSTAFALKLQAQPCITLGQNPSTAFPVCESDTFRQGSVNICGNTTVVSRCTGPNALFTDKNPYWYKFTCFTSGTLGFVIRPDNLGDDYDWQLFDVTNRNIANVYSDISMFVACNWSGEVGITGASAAGNSLIRCEGPGVPLFSSMPFIIQGHEYLLLISHFTDSQSGYALSFGGGTGSITDPTDPQMVSAKADCDGTVISIKLNKKMKCKSITASGSEFSISPPIANVISATAIGCTQGFDTDSVLISLSNALVPGDYIITINNGTDANTIVDNCGDNIPVGSQIPLTVLPILPTPMDSLTKPKCAPNQLELIFRKSIKCSSISPDGSDFSITGTYPVSIASATGICINGRTTRIIIQLSAPLQRAGNFRITLNRGSDGNTLLDECTQETPAGQFIPFEIKDTVNANFNSTIFLGCKTDTIKFNHNGANGVNFWSWSFENQPGSNLQNPIVYYTVFGIKQVKLIVGNGVCFDTSNAPVNLTNFLKAGFIGEKFVCPGDVLQFTDTSIGQIINWNWDFGNGNTFSGQLPPSQTYLPAISSNYYALIKLVVKNNINCLDTATLKATIVWNCYIDVPNAFTPNGDGLNDFLYPLNAYKAKSLKFSVYNRFGQRIFYTEDWTKKWNGMFNAKRMDIGTYVWVLQYYDENNVFKQRRGTTILLR